VSAIARPSEVESSYAWARLLASLMLSSLGAVAMYGVVVALPEIEREFGVARADASMPYAMTMIGFGVGGILMGAGRSLRRHGAGDHRHAGPGQRAGARR